MKELIIKTLEENRLYDDNYDMVLYNNPDDFFKSYSINTSSNNPLPPNLKRDKNGFLTLNSQPFIISDLKTDGHNYNFWILFKNGSRALLKMVSRDEFCMELLFQELANNLNITSAKYDGAILNKIPYLISQSFLSLEEYLFDYYNIEEKLSIDVKELIDESKKINQKEFVQKMLFIDLLSHHLDRFPHNFKVIMNSGQINSAPLYDNGLCCIGKKHKSKFIIPKYKNSSETSSILEYLISDEDFKKWIINNIGKIEPLRFKNKIEKERKIYIDNNINELFTNAVLKNVELTKKILKNS